MADETVAPLRDLHREVLVAEIARAVPVQHDVPLLRVGFLVAERREGNPHLEDPPVARDAGGRVPEVVGGAVLAGRVVGVRVVLDAVRVREEEDRAPRLPLGVEDDAAVIGGARHVVPVAVRRPDLVGRRVGELEPGVQKLLVVREIADVRDRRRRVVAGVGLVPGGYFCRTLPAGVREVAVHDDRPLRAGDRDRDSLVRGRPEERGGSENDAHQQPGTKAFVARHRLLRRGIFQKVWAKRAPGAFILHSPVLP